MYTTELTKGVNLHLVPTNKFQTISLCLLFRTPLIKATVTANALLSKALLNGCAKYKTRQQIEIRLEEINSILTTEIMKKGEEHIIELFAKTTPTYIEDLIELIGDIVLKPLFNNMDYSKEDLKSTINSLVNDKRKYALQKCIENMCEKEPYGINGDGYIEDINNVAIHSRYNQIISNSKIDIIAIGNIDFGEIIDYFLKYIPLSPRDTTLEPCSYAYYPTSEKDITEEMDITQGKLCMGFRMNVDPTSTDWYKLIVANELFGGSASSSLFMEARESQSLCYYISSKLLRFKSLMLIEAGIDAGNKDKVTDIIKNAFNNVNEEGLSVAKENIINSYKIAQDKPEAIMDSILGSLILHAPSSFEQAIEGISSVDTIEDIFNESCTDTTFMLSPITSNKEVNNAQHNK